MIHHSIALVVSLLALSAVVVAPGSALADSDKGASAVEDPSPVPVVLPGAYAFATAEGQANGAVFMKIYSTEADTLVGARSPAAKTVELHEHTMEGDVMGMRKVDRIALPAYGTTTFHPMGYHVMLIGLNAPLVAGGEVPVTLSFEANGDVDVVAKIVPPGTTPESQDAQPAPMMHDMDHMEHMDHSGHDMDHGK